MSDSAGSAGRVLRLTFMAMAVMSGPLVGMDALGQPGRSNIQPTLRVIRVESAKDGPTTVVIEGNGALPEPSSGAPLNPPRIYLDFSNVLSSATVQRVAPNPDRKSVV